MTKAKTGQDDQIRSKNNNSNHTEQFEYLQKPFEYAFPEHIRTDKDLDVSEYQDLYDAGYTFDVMNQLMQKLRNVANSQKHPTGTKILILDVCQDVNTLSELLLKSLDQVNTPTKLVFLMPIAIGPHAHSLVVHINTVNNQSKVHVIFKDPFGQAYAFETKQNAVITQVKKFVEEQFTVVDFKHKSDVVDLQGFDYDNSNCGPLTVYCLHKFLEHALQDSLPDEYKVRLSFDLFADAEQNTAAHKALMLRLKVAQLSKVTQDQALAFQSAEGAGYVNSDKTKKAWDAAKQVWGKIRVAVNTKYIAFLDQTSKEKIQSFTEWQKIDLLNLISVHIINTSTSNLINPMSLSESINRIIAYFNTDIEPITDEQRQMTEELQAYTGDMLNAAILGVIPRSIGSSDNELIRIVKLNNLNAFTTFIQSQPPEQLRSIINAHDRFGKTALVYAIKNNHIDIVRHLVMTGADILLKIHGFGQNALKVSAFEGQSIEIFSLLLESIKSNPNFLSIITDLLSSVVGHWLHNKDKFIFIKDNQNVPSLILDKLLIERADPFIQPIISAYENSVVHGVSPMSNIAGLKPSMVEIFLKHYPEKLSVMFLEAIKSNNKELVLFLETWINKQESTDNLAKLVKLFKASPESCNLIFVGFCVNHKLMDQELIEEAISFIDHLLYKLNQEEERLSWPGANDTRRIADIRYKKTDAYKIKKELLKTKLDELSKSTVTKTHKEGLEQNSDLSIPKQQKLLSNCKIFETIEIDSVGVDQYGCSDHTQFMRATKSNDIAKVRSFVASGAIKNINMFDESGYNALLYGVMHKTQEIVKFLLENGAQLDVISTSIGKQAAFKMAILQQDVAMLKLLIDFANQHSINLDISELLVLATKRRDQASIKYLFSLNSITPAMVQKAINESIQINDLDLLQLFLTKADNDVLNTPLQAQRWLPLERAVIKLNLEAVKLLIQKGADVNKQSGHQSPLHYAVTFAHASKQEHLEIVKMLLENKAEVNRCYQMKWIFGQGYSLMPVTTILGDAIKNGNLEIVKLLVEYGADVNGFSYIKIALELRDQGILKYLIDSGAPIDWDNLKYNERQMLEDLSVSQPNAKESRLYSEFENNTYSDVVLSHKKYKKDPNELSQSNDNNYHCDDEMKAVGEGSGDYDDVV